MKKILLQLILLLFAYSCVAQKTREVAFGSGIVNYVGDLANEKYFPYSAANAGMQLTLRNILNNSANTPAANKPLSLDLRLGWYRLQYDETQPLGGKSGAELRNYLRGLSFRNDLFGTMVDFTYTFYTDRYRPL